MIRFLENSTGDGVTAPLDASYYKGCGLRQGLEREFVLIEVCDESMADDNGSVVCKQPSGELYGAGCVQQHAAGDKERR